MFGLESYVGRVEKLVTSEGIDEDPHYVGYGAWVELGKLLFFKDCMGAQRYMAIFKEPSSFGALWGKLLT
jgi:hypothetical protein